MKGKQLITAVGGIVLGGLGLLMVASNPGQQAYEAYATEKLSLYVKEKVCTQVPEKFGDFLQRQCHSLVDTNRAQIRQIIAENTQRKNLLLFSIYQTDLSLPASLPDYHFETLGILQNFYITQAERV